VNIITADQIQQGDKIRVTTNHGDRIDSATGVAHNLRKSPSGKHRWFTADDWSLWTGADDAVIELLDRPKPKITVPSGRGAVVTYMYGWVADGELEKRTVVRDSSEKGGWIAYDESGYRMNGFYSDQHFAQCLSESDSMHDVKVLFEGVAK